MFNETFPATKTNIKMPKSGLYLRQSHDINNKTKGHPMHSLQQPQHTHLDIDEIVAAGNLLPLVRVHPVEDGSAGGGGGCGGARGRGCAGILGRRKGKQSE